MTDQMTVGATNVGAPLPAMPEAPAAPAPYTDAPSPDTFELSEEDPNHHIFASNNPPAGAMNCDYSNMGIGPSPARPSVPMTPISINVSEHAGKFVPLGRGCEGIINYSPTCEQYGQSHVIEAIEDLGVCMSGMGYNVCVGDISFAKGGDHPQHVSHENGLDVDFRPIAKDGYCGPVGCYSTSQYYDFEGTKKMILALAQSGLVKCIYFNDPNILSDPEIKETGLVSRCDGHNDHVHVSFKNIKQLAS